MSQRRWLVVFTAIGMLALLIYLTAVGLAKAAQISNVLSIFVAVAAVLVSVWFAQPSASTESTTRVGPARSSEDELPVPKPDAVPLQPLAVAAVLLGVAVSVAASDALLRYPAAGPWWVAVAAAVLGFVAASLGARADLARAGILIINTLWFFGYSVLVIEWRQPSSSPADLGHLALLSWIGAAANALFLVLVNIRDARSRRVPTSWLGWQPLLLASLALGMAFNAMAVRSGSRALSGLAGCLFIVALVADVASLVRPSRTALGEGAT